MKGIILTGGSGTRLYPLTLSVSKLKVQENIKNFKGDYYKYIKAILD